jgi:AraC-like DNA-binding protein
MRLQRAAQPINERPASWASAYVSLVERAQVMTVAPGPSDAAVDAGELGPLRIISMSCGQARIRRREREIGHVSERTFTFILQVEGTSGFKHYGHQVTLQPGDFTLADNAAPYSLHVDGDAKLIMLRGSLAAVKEHLPTPDFFCGRRLGADQSLASTAGAMLVSLARQLDDGLSEECRARAARHLLAMIAGSFVEAFDQAISGSSIMAGRHWKVKLFIERHLRDPELSPSVIADQLRISSRYLRMIFAANEETPSAYILRRRLEECANRLADPRWRGHSITEIAFSWGFNSAPHFTRSFRERFDASPRDYRQRELQAAGLPGHARASGRGDTLTAVAA